MNSRVVRFVVAMFITTSINAQERNNKEFIDTAIEKIISRSVDIDNSPNIYVDYLVDRHRNPLNLNTTTVEELTELFILSTVQIQAILNYRYRENGFKTIYELQLIKELDIETIKLLQFFVYIGKEKMSNPSFKHIVKYSKRDLTLRLDLPINSKKGDKGSFLGSSYYNSVRYTSQFKDRLFIGFIAEKDRGEPFFGPHNKYGYDYYSFYFQLEKWGNLESFIIGNYRLNFGLGLTIGTANFGGKSNSINTYFSKKREINKHSSTDENNYLQGVAFRYKWGALKWTLFYSNKSLDGTIKDGAITSFSTSGLHRTKKEIEKKNAVKLETFGGRVSYINKKFNISYNNLFYRFNKPLSVGTLPYKKYDMVGRNYYNISFDYSLNLSKFVIKGESAFSKKGKAFLHQIYYSPTSEYELLLIHRYYDVDYWSFYAKAFGGGKVKNENGWFFALQTTAVHKLLLRLSLDFYSSPWWKYRVSKPSKSSEIILEANYAINKNNNLLFKYKYYKRERDVSGVKPKVVEKIQTHKFDVKYDWYITNWLLSKTSFGLTLFEAKKRSQGIHLTQRFTSILAQNRCKIDLQGSYFNSTNHDSRLYMYEKGLLYTFSSNSFSGKGCRVSLNVNYKIIDRITLMAKYGVTTYFDKKEIGTGDDLIDKNYKMDLQFMLRINL